MRRFLEAVAENEDYSFENYGQGATVESVLADMFGKGDFEMLQDVSATAIGDLVEAAELFNEINGTEYDSIRVPTETVIFSSEQAKLTGNKVPTSNPDVRYSLSSSEELQRMGAEKYRITQNTARSLAETLSEYEEQIRADGMAFRPSMDRVGQVARGFADENGLTGEDQAAFVRTVGKAAQDMRETGTATIRSEEAIITVSDRSDVLTINGRDRERSHDGTHPLHCRGAQLRGGIERKRKQSGHYRIIRRYISMKDWMIRAIKTFAQAFFGVLISGICAVLNGGFPEDLDAASLLAEKERYIALRLHCCN